MLVLTLAASLALVTPAQAANKRAEKTPAKVQGLEAVLAAAAANEPQSATRLLSSSQHPTLVIEKAIESAARSCDPLTLARLKLLAGDAVAVGPLADTRAEIQRKLSLYLSEAQKEAAREGIDIKVTYALEDHKKCEVTLELLNTDALKRVEQIGWPTKGLLRPSDLRAWGKESEILSAALKTRGSAPTQAHSKPGTGAASERP